MVRIILSLLLIFQPAFGQSVNSPVMGDYAVGLMSADTNFVLNPIAEKNDFNKTTSSATATRDTDAADALYGKASWLCDASAQNGYCEFTLKTITHPAQDGSCAAYIQYKGDASLYKLQILDGSSNVLSSSPVLTNASVWTAAEATYPCGSARQVRLTQTEAGTGAAVNLGVYYGKNQNIGTVAQPVVVAVGYIAGTTACDWSRTNATLGAFGTDADCPGVTVTENNTSYGTLQTTDADLPNFTVNSLAKGKYRVTMTGLSIPATGAAGDTQTVAIYDGTSYDGRQSMQYASSGAHPSTLVGIFNYTTTANVTFSIHGASSASAIVLRNTNTQSRLQFIIERLPDQEQVVRMSQTNFDWTTCPTLTYTGFGTPSAIDLKCSRQGSNLKVKGRFTAGTTTAVIASFTIPYGLTASSSKATTSVSPHGTSIRDGGGAAYSKYLTLLASAGDTTIKFGSANDSDTQAPLTALNGNAFASSGQILTIDLNVPIQGWEENQNAPLIAGGVTSGYSGTVRIEAASISSTGVVTETTGDWISGNCTVAGGGNENKACVIITGIFSSAPVCFSNAFAGGVIFSNFGALPTTTAFSINTSTSAGGTQQGAMVTCIGPR